MGKYTLHLVFCLLLGGTSDSYGTVLTLENTESNGNVLVFSFCGRTKTESVIEGPFKKLGSSYYLFETKQEVTWYRAAHICRSYDAHLVSIESGHEMEILSNYLIGAGHAQKFFWTSGNDLDTEGTFLWLATGNLFSYTKWSAGQPDNHSNLEHCVQLWSTEKDSVSFNDRPCNYKMHYICEKH